MKRHNPTIRKFLRAALFACRAHPRDRSLRHKVRALYQARFMPQDQMRRLAGLA